MEKVKSLSRYQKGILLVLAALVLVFAAAYFVRTARVGYLYQDVILVPSQEAGSTVYSGKIQGQPAAFRVSEEKTVIFQYGETVYGTYTAVEDPSAIPEDADLAESMTGVELRQGEKLFFRGGVADLGDYCLLYNEDGTVAFLSVVVVSGGEVRDENGQIIDPMEPSPLTILELMAGPELVHKGTWWVWFGGVFLSLLTGFSVVYTQDLFRWQLRFLIRDPDRAEPSDWEITRWHIGWTISVAAVLFLFLLGLD